MSTELLFDLPCLDSPVEVLIDGVGVPHLYARSTRDLFIAQGFVAARDRLFQMDLWLRRGTGRLAEVLGESYAEQDAANRLLRYRGDLAAEWAAYGEGTRQIVEAFVQGVNAFVDVALAQSDHLPPEFVALGVLPARWTAEDIVRSRTHGLFYNVEHELARALTLRDAGADAEDLRQTREPCAPISVPDGLDLSMLSDEMLRTYRLAFSPVDFENAATPQSHTLLGGSNNWVLDGTLTASGRPILASDPHRAVLLPSLRYLVHLNCPEFNVIGAGEPTLPGVSIGHNGKVAFGLTIWPADQEDLYVYELNPSNALEYRYQGSWERMRVESEYISLANGEPVTADLKFTRHGPVIHFDEQRGIAVAVRAAWLEPGMTPYLGSLRYLSASNDEEFIGALESWGAPGVNQVYATVDGSVGWQASALVPRRPNWDGSLPVPGDGRYEWAGFARASELPSERNPSCGWFASANQMNLPADYDFSALPITHDWYSDARYARIVEWLANENYSTVEASVRMQWDCLSTHAATICRLLQTLPTDGILEADVWQLLMGWDGAEDVSSIAATIFEVWLRKHFRPWLIAHTFRAAQVTSDAVDRAMERLMRDESFNSDLRPEIAMISALGWSTESNRSVIVEGINSTLSAALDEIASLLGDDRTGWGWGQLHTTTLTHPLHAVLPDELVTLLGPVGRSGSGDTVGMVGYGPDFTQTLGSTFRMVIDVGEWENSRAINAPGQSGDPRSPHYDNLFEPWASGETFALRYSRASVEADLHTRIVLVPREK